MSVNAETAASPSQAPYKPAPAPNPVRRPAFIVVALALVLFFYGLIADRSTPYTSQATVQAYGVKVAPEVAGKVIEVGVGDNARLAAGNVSLRVDMEPYRLAVERAEAELETAGQSVGSSTATVAAAEASRVTAIAERQNVRKQSAWILELAMCCGGSAPVETGACCIQDVAAKNAGLAGCGCLSSAETNAVKEAEPTE
jgi:multidrug resistance efflux pump